MNSWITSNAFAQRELVPAFSPDVTGCTVRAVIPLGLSGTGLKLVFAEDYGTHPAEYLEAAVVLGGTFYPVSFQGNSAFSVAPGSRLVSDEIPVRFCRGDTLTLLLAVGSAPSASETSLEQQHSLPGRYVQSCFEAVSWQAPVPGLPFNERLCGLKEILVKTEHAAALAVFGDSVTESGVWTGPLSERLACSHPDITLLNLGIGGNRLLRDTHVPAMNGKQAFGRAGLSRLESDLFQLSGVRAVILAMGINDIAQPGGPPGFSPPEEELCSFEELQDGFTNTIQQCRRHHLGIIGATVTPFKGFPSYGEQSAEIRRKINRWICGSAGFDYVLDLASTLSAEEDPEILEPSYGVGDGLHPNPAGGSAAAGTLDVEAMLKAVHLL